MAGNPRIARVRPQANARLDLVRIITNIAFQDPYTMRIKKQFTYRNQGGVPFVGPVEFHKTRTGGKEFYAELQITDATGKPLELLPAGPSHETIEVGPISLKPDEQTTLSFSYVEVTDEPKSSRWFRLFDEPDAILAIPLGDFRHYVSIQPALRVLLSWDRDASFTPTTITNWVHEPPSRNALFVRFDEYSTSAKKEAAYQLIREAGIGLQPVDAAKTAYEASAPKSRFWWPRSRKKMVERMERIVAQAGETASANLAQIRIQQRLSWPLKAWFWTVCWAGFLAAILSSQLTASGSVIALLAVTRSWMFYEERMMRRVGWAIVGLLILNLLTVVWLASGQEDPLAKWVLENVGLWKE